VLVELQWEDVLHGSRSLKTECVSEAESVPAGSGMNVVRIEVNASAGPGRRAPASYGSCANPPLQFYYRKPARLDPQNRQHQLPLRTLSRKSLILQVMLMTTKATGEITARYETSGRDHATLRQDRSEASAPVLLEKKTEWHKAPPACGNWRDLNDHGGVLAVRGVDAHPRPPCPSGM